MLGEHGGARDGRGHDQRIAGRLIVRADRIAVRRRRFRACRTGAAISVPSFSMTRTTGFARRLARTGRRAGTRRPERGRTSCSGSPARASGCAAHVRPSRAGRTTLRNTRSSAVRSSRDSARACVPAAAEQAARLAGLVGDQDLLDRRGGHDGAAHRIGIDVGAGGEPRRSDRRQRRDRLADAPLGARDRTLRREASFFGGLPLDVGVDAALDHRHRNSGDQGPGDDRNELAQPAGNHGILIGLPRQNRRSSVKARLRCESVFAHAANGAIRRVNRFDAITRRSEPHRGTRTWKHSSSARPTST